jgi:hypothetical protein
MHHHPWEILATSDLLLISIRCSTSVDEVELHFHQRSTAAKSFTIMPGIGSSSPEEKHFFVSVV